MAPQNLQTRPIGALYTGGTFGMIPSHRGYVPSLDLPGRAEAALADREHPPIQWLDPETGPPITSSDITPAFWHQLATVIRRHAGEYAGFVVIHGTDTLAFTGSALSFLLADLDRPVVVTGARAPLGEPNSDATDNFLAGLHAAASEHNDAVGLVFGGQLLRANRASKRFGAPQAPFTSPHAAPLATFDQTLLWHDEPPAPKMALPAVQRRDARVAMIPVYPGITGATLRAVRDSGADALLLEAYPASVGPGSDADFVQAIRELTANGTVVAAVSQNQYGSVHLGRYASSTPLAEAGLIGGADMTREAALTKLHYLLCAEVAYDRITELFSSNLRGELTPA